MYVPILTIVLTLWWLTYNLLQALVELNPKVIYPGHGPTVEDPVTKLLYYISHRNQREEQILDMLSAETKFLSVMELVKTIYKVRKDLICSACLGGLSS